MEIVSAQDSSNPAVAVQQDEEVDVWWGAYAGRALVPSFVLSGLLTFLIIGAALYLGAWHGSTPLRYVTHFLIISVWIVQIGRGFYLVAAINYRLTTRRMFVERGFQHPGKPGIELAQISQVLVVRGLTDRWLGVGKVFLILEGCEASLALEGLRDPDFVAMEIRKQLKRVRTEAAS